MGFTSFLGRLLFSSIFILSAWHKINDFGHDGGSVVKAMEPKIITLHNHANSFGILLPEIELKHIVIGWIALEGLGGLLFTLGSSLGAYLLLIFLAVFTPIMYDFYNYALSSSEYAEEFLKFLTNLSLFGALLFFLGANNHGAKKSKKRVIKTKVN